MRRRYVIEDTSFIFLTHFAGKKREGDRYPVNGRSYNIIIPDPDLAEEMYNDGFDVRQTTPPEGHEEGFEPEFYIKCQLKYKSEGGANDPVVCLVEEDSRGREYSVELDEELVGNLDGEGRDGIRIKRGSVCVTLSPYTRGGGEHPTLYTQALYVKHDLESDTWRARFPRREDLDD